MPKIPIKVKKNSQMKQVADDLRLDLRETAAAGQRDNFWPKKANLILFGSLILIILGLLSKIIFFRPAQIPFYEDLSKQAVVFGLMDQEGLFQQALPLGQMIEERGFSQTLTKISQAIKRAGLNFPQDVQMLFEKQTIFALLPADSQTGLPVVLILKRLVAKDKIDQFLARFEPELKKDYDFSSQNYRQIEITALEPISVSASLFYGQLNDYFVITNSQSSMEKIIDLLIKQ